MSPPAMANCRGGVSPPIVREEKDREIETLVVAVADPAGVRRTDVLFGQDSRQGSSFHVGSDQAQSF
jgi:hypothetical protein